MFNVIMRHYDWNDAAASMQLGRMLEFTDDDVAAKFMDGDLPALDRLRTLPTLFILEGTGDEICRVGTVTSARIANREVRFEYALDPDVPPLQNGFLHAHKRELDMDRHRYDFDWGHNHWAVKDVDLYRFLLRRINPRRQRPTVFGIPDHEAVEPQLASVMMPFDAGFAPVYAAIQQAGIACNLVTRRADEIWEAPGIIQEVVNLIDRARLVVSAHKIIRKLARKPAPSTPCIEYSPSVPTFKKGIGWPADKRASHALPLLIRGTR